MNLKKVEIYDKAATPDHFRSISLHNWLSIKIHALIKLCLWSFALISAGQESGGEKPLALRPVRSVINEIIKLSLVVPERNPAAHHGAD